MLQVRHLSKRYQTLLALDDVSFDVTPGEILGYLGPNGSGKSTTINMVVGLLEPTKGSLTLGGQRLDDQPEEYRRRIGYVPEEPHLYVHLTALEYLRLVGQLRGFRKPALEAKITGLLRLFQLWDSRYLPMSAFSKGMRQRVMLSAALMHAPDLLVLDEPFSGLDVAAGLLFKTLLRRFVADQRMILFSSHRLDIVQELCARVVILSAGRIAAQGDVQRLCASDAAPENRLEHLFARVTRQEDYSSVADEILDLIRS